MELRAAPALPPGVGLEGPGPGHPHPHGDLEDTGPGGPADGHWARAPGASPMASPLMDGDVCPGATASCAPRRCSTPRCHTGPTLEWVHPGGKGETTQEVATKPLVGKATQGQHRSANIPNQSPVGPRRLSRRASRGALRREGEPGVPRALGAVQDQDEDNSAAGPAGWLGTHQYVSAAARLHQASGAPRFAKRKQGRRG